MERLDRGGILQEGQAGFRVNKYKNEVGCRDDTMPKTVGTRRHCEGEHATIFRNPQKPRCRDWVAEDCCMLSLLLAVPSCTYSFWHGVIPTSYFIFILVSLIFYPGLALTVARGGHQSKTSEPIANPWSSP